MTGRILSIRGTITCLFLSVIIALTGCTAKAYRESADKQVYHILKHRRNTELGLNAPFTIDQPQADPLVGLPKKVQPLIPSTSSSTSPEASSAEPVSVISLAKAIETAILNSRDYQSRKEDVYLSALDLTLERHAWSPTFSALLSGRWQRANKDESWVADGDFGFTQALETGGSVTVGLGTQFMHFMVGDTTHTARSTLSFEFIQPLWRGRGKAVAQENLKQSERDVIYSIRSFARYHKTFVVDIASRFYRVLRQRDVVRNEWNNYQRLVVAADRAANLAQAGRLPEFEVDQAKQDELRAKDRWIRSVQEYKQLLDQLKILLALPTDADVDVDETDLADLVRNGVIHPQIASDAAVSQAITLRLDMLTAEDRVADAERKVAVAKNGLGADINLVATSTVGTQGDSKPAKFRFDQGAYSGGLDVDLPLDRKAERNTYRRALIESDRAHRDASELADNVKLQVRRAWRTLKEAKESHGVQRISLELAERRVESTTLLLRAGRADTRDVLDAQAALLEAQNAVTRALIDHTIAKLELWRDIGTLVVNPNYELEDENLGQGRTTPKDG